MRIGLQAQQSGAQPQGKSAKLIGLIFPNISNVFYAELIDKLGHELFKQDIKPPSAIVEHDSDKERKCRC